MNQALKPEPSPPADFNRLARMYRWMELASFGPWLWWCRCAFLRSLSDCRRAVVIGDGDGRFTARLLSTNPTIQIDAVDASSAMLRSLLRRSGADTARVRAWCADVRTWKPQDAPYDLIVTHFFLDCLTTAEIQAMAQTLHNTATPSALWLISEFAVPAGVYGRLFARPLVSCLYWIFGQLTGLTLRALPDHRAALRQSGFTLQKQHNWLGGLLISELWSANAQ